MVYIVKTPRNNPDAKIIHKVEKIDDKIRALASGSGSNRGTGGMVSKLDAAEMVTSKGIDMVIAHGSKPEKIFDIMMEKKLVHFLKVQNYNKILLNISFYDILFL